jgi:hypothetical protein
MPHPACASVFDRSLVCLLSLPALAATPYQVADLEILPDCCAPATPPTYVGVVRDRAFFLIGPPNAASLWSTDGTAASRNLSKILPLGTWGTSTGRSRSI